MVGVQCHLCFRESPSFGVRRSSSNPALPCASCVTLGKLFHPFENRFWGESNEEKIEAWRISQGSSVCKGQKQTQTSLHKRRHQPTLARAIVRVPEMQAPSTLPTAPFLPVLTLPYPLGPTFPHPSFHFSPHLPSESIRFPFA